jgi:serine/threonine-protein kinase
VTLLGTGGMGEVYKARDARIGRDVAIKLATAPSIDRFQHERRAIAALNHPNICTLYDVGPNYIVTELVEGDTLRGWLMRVPPMSRRIDVGRQVLDALRAAHRAGYIHRDLKPQNIMVRSDGYVKVLDFGLAKQISAVSFMHETAATIEVTQPGQIIGTIAYMSPEQICGHPVDERSDLFAVGIILYEMLTGQHPWRRASTVDTLHAILHDDAPVAPIEVVAGAHVASVIHRLLQKDPPARFSSAEAVLDALGTGVVTASTDATASSSDSSLISIAVLPFFFLSEVDECRALSLGFADALITILGNLDTIAVAPTSAIVAYAPGTDPSRVCHDLGVRYSLQGNVQRLGTRWRVSLQLFDATHQRLTSAERHDLQVDNMFDVQDEIGRHVVSLLERRFPVTASKSRDRYSQDPEAYDAFITGLRESYGNSLEELHRAARHLRMSVDRDPEFALAHAWLSHVAMQIYWNFDSQPIWATTAEEHCQRALSLDPTLPEGHWAHSAILWSPAKNFQHAEAIAALERVLAILPNFDRAHNRMAAICLHIGRFEEARIAHDLAVKSNPKNRTRNLEFVTLCSGDFAAAEVAGEAWVKETPNERFALWFHPQPPLLTGNLDLAAKRLDVALQHYPDEPLIVSLFAMLQASRGETTAALEAVRKTVECPRSFGHTHHTYEQIACVYSTLAETEKALAWLHRCIESGNPCWPFFKMHPLLENLRRDPRFDVLITALQQKYSQLAIARL